MSTLSFADAIVAHRLTPAEISLESAHRTNIAQVEARTGRRCTTYQPGRGCYVARLDGIDQPGVYHSAIEAVEALLAL